MLCSKLKEFLDLERGNHSVFDYTRQFNTLGQYGTYHVDTDEKKANLYHAGTFFLNKHPIIILFDFGASHDFVSSTCAKKVMLSTVDVEAPYVISTPKCWVDVDQIVRKATLELAGRVFSTLIMLKGQGQDVILGMSWMKLHRVVLDIAG
jgi:predicted aspartyl protease